MSADRRRVDPVNGGYAEELLRRFHEEPGSVPRAWRAWFERLDGAPPPAEPSRPERGVFRGGERDDARAELVQERFESLVAAFVEEGHRAAAIDPLGRRRADPACLRPETHGLIGADLDALVRVGPHEPRQTVRSAVRHLRRSWCGPLTARIAHLRDADAREWLRTRLEARSEHARPEPAERVRLLERLLDATVFERFVRKKFLGVKSFSLEGAESLLVLLDAAIERAQGLDVAEVVLAMTHRGRLAILAELLDRDPREMFRELRDEVPHANGDLQHHLGASTDRDGVHVSLCFNPSHLEFVGPIALGRTRAKQERHGDRERSRGLALIVHGDAGFAGEGVTAELLNMSALDAYDTGGSVHVVLDNGIGFTTLPEQGRAGEYASDEALGAGIPVLHVDADDPEAVARAARIALDYRARFRRSVFVELHAYRRLGHNELDEPRITQPCLYARIDDHPPVDERYARRLLEDGVLDEDAVESMRRERRAELEDALDEGDAPRGPHAEPHGVWEDYRGGDVTRRGTRSTGVRRERLVELLERTTRVPEGFRTHRKVERVLAARREMARGERPLDWATAEALAFATLAAEGAPVRLTGQDSERGTFGQRHAVLHDVESGATHEPLRRVAPDAAPVVIRNSPLSEAAVLGFEYGYSLDRPEGLTLWEAQFGDFANAAQVVLDQFLFAAEDKWKRLSGLVLLLPHGFEGQGPEHSSARLERFLHAAAEDNIQVVQPSSPAAYFHVLRRQVLQGWRKPLVVMTPKSLLRERACVSSLDELASGSFEPVVSWRRDGEEALGRILLATGKVAYELEAARVERERRDVRVVTLEELYPFPEEALRAVLDTSPSEIPVVWVQEEPENMGGWLYVQAMLLRRFAERRVHGVCRTPSASPAGGSAANHREEQRELMERAFEEA